MLAEQAYLALFCMTQRAQANTTTQCICTIRKMEERWAWILPLNETVLSGNWIQMCTNTTATTQGEPRTGEATETPKSIGSRLVLKLFKMENYCWNQPIQSLKWSPWVICAPGLLPPSVLQLLTSPHTVRSLPMVRVLIHVNSRLMTKMAFGTTTGKPMGNLTTSWLRL